MKQLILILICMAALMCGCKKNEHKRPWAEDDRTVYLCDSPNAKAYHYDRYCDGLQSCTHEVVEATEDEASGYRRPCRRCVK